MTSKPKTLESSATQIENLRVHLYLLKYLIGLSINLNKKKKTNNMYFWIMVQYHFLS